MFQSLIFFGSYLDVEILLMAVGVYKIVEIGFPRICYYCLNSIFEEFFKIDKILCRCNSATSPPHIFRQAQQIYGNNSVNFTAWQPNVWTVSDYYPFGMQMEERRMGVGGRFGYNGKEMDNEVKGEGNSLDFGARMYDSRVGRWLSLDPLAGKYPGISPYAFVGNSPIRFIDPDGREIKDALIKGTLYEPVFNKVMSLDVMKKLLKPIIESTRSHYTLTYLPYYRVDNSAGQSYEGRKGSSRTNYNSIIGGIGMFTLGAKVTLTEIGMAQTVIHESFHAIIFKGLNDGSIKRKEIRGDDQEHNYLATNYQPKILEALTEYNKNQNLGIDDEGLKTLSWVGLEGTDAYDEAYKDDESKKEQQTKASKLLYKIEQANTETSKPNENNSEKGKVKDE